MNSDNHSHILYEGIRSMVQAGRSKNIDCLSITEHISQFKEARSSIKFGSVHRTGRVFSDFEEYRLQFESLDDHALQVKMGLEVDFSPRYEKEVSSLANQEKWDILLCSVHEMENGLDIESKSHPQDRESSQKRWIEYVELQKKALTSEFFRFDILAHPVRLGRSTQIIPSNIDELFLELATLANVEGKALELNGNDIMKDYALVEKLASACARVCCRVSFGSDAHYQNEVARGYGKARELIQDRRLGEWEP